MRGGNTSTPWQSIVLRLSLNDETAITPTLQQLNSSMHDMLSVGSYPVTGQVTFGHPARGTPVPWLDQALLRRRQPWSADDTPAYHIICWS